MKLEFMGAAQEVTGSKHLITTKKGLKILLDCHGKGAWSDAALRAELAKHDLSGADAALCVRIVYGVLQSQFLLDYDLKNFCTRDFQKLDLTVLDILRIGAYQILFLDRVPDRAAVNESVNLAKKHGYSSASGLVNAVLRKLSANRDDLPDLPKDDIKSLSIEYSCPEWMVARFIKSLGTDETREFLKSCDVIPPVCIQTNWIKTNSENLQAELRAAGMDITSHSWLAGCLEARGTGNITQSKAFRDGKFFVQDPAARLVTALGGVQPGMRILDICAAPGGKSFSAAIDARNQGEIISCDIDRRKLKFIQDGASRMGLNMIKTARADGREFHPEWEKRFDLVIADVPCSGFGILRKKPDIRYKYHGMDDLSGLFALQREILNNAASYVKPGGKLIYSTCSILPEENEFITDAFLKRRPEFIPRDFAASYPGIINHHPGQVTLWPHRHGTDGFYIRVMKKIPEA